MFSSNAVWISVGFIDKKIFKMDYLMMIMESLKLSLKNIKQFYVKLSTPHGFGFWGLHYLQSTVVQKY